MVALRGRCFLAAVALSNAEVFLSPTQAMSVTEQPQVPIGVNFGGWLNLEDWFFSGTHGSTVMTAGTIPQGQGACLPPLVTQLSQHWASEGALVKHLTQTKSAAETAEIFMAHRRSFIGNQDLEDLVAAGIKKIRVPLNWGMFADALAPLDNNTYGAHNPDEDAVVVPDPFYDSEISLVTVPRNWFRTFLRRCAKHNLTTILDMHSLPGASSDGTYNSVWPLPPKFWSDNSRIGSLPLTQVGQLITDAMIKFVEELSDEERGAVGGVTFMNEPAHMSAPARQAGHPWASEMQVLKWLAEAGDKFRKSQLPAMGVKMYCNVIETAFENFNDVVPVWWNYSFTESEQHKWAVMDVHWYTAWSGGDCSGRTVSGGAYYCDQPQDEIQQVLQRCTAGYANNMQKLFKGLKAISEFSLGTHEVAHAACQDVATRTLYLKEQLQAFTAAGVEPFMWTWRMPHGPNFEAGWSLKHFLGKEYKTFDCLQPTPTPWSGEL